MRIQLQHHIHPVQTPIKELPAAQKSLRPQPPCVRSSAFQFSRCHQVLAKRKNLIETIDHEICIVDRDAHRRLDAKHVAVQPAFAEQKPALARKLKHRRGLIFRRLLAHPGL